MRKTVVWLAVAAAGLFVFYRWYEARQAQNLANEAAPDMTNPNATAGGVTQNAITAAPASPMGSFLNANTISVGPDVASLGSQYGGGGNFYNGSSQVSVDQSAPAIDQSAQTPMVPVNVQS